jgi:hypothetical protein
MAPGPTPYANNAHTTTDRTGTESTIPWEVQRFMVGCPVLSVWNGRPSLEDHFMLADVDDDGVIAGEGDLETFADQLLNVQV